MNKLIVLFALLFSIHIFSESKPLYQNLIDNIPELGKESTVYLGDRMLTQRQGQFKECFVPKRNFVADSKGTGFEFLSNKPVCKIDEDGEYYYANYTLSSNCRGIETVGTCVYFTSASSPVLLIENEIDYELHIGFPKSFGKGFKFNKAYKIKGINKNDLKVDQNWFLYEEDSFQQTIEYSGKSGDILKFIYSEFTAGFARQAFTREFTADLSEGNIGAYKGALFEILEATNSQIKYKIIRHFPETR